MKTTTPKRLRALRSVLPALPLLLLFSCSDSGAPSCRITKVTENNETQYEFQYNADKEMTTIVNYDDGILLDSPAELIRNADGKVTSFDLYFDGAMTAQQVLAYEGDKLMSYTYNYDDNDDGIVDAFFRSVTYAYSGSEITSATELYSGLETVETYQWTNGNITKITAENGSYTVYTYDTKKNPVHTPGNDFLQGVGMAVFTIFNANNITKIERYNDQDVLLTTETRTYTYNDQDFPLSYTVAETGDEGTFEYNCD